MHSPVEPAVSSSAGGTLQERGHLIGINRLKQRSFELIVKRKPGGLELARSDVNVIGCLVQFGDAVDDHHPERSGTSLVRQANAAGIGVGESAAQVANELSMRVPNHDERIP